MLDSGGGGGYGGTDWSTKTVIEMWQALEGQETTPHYQLLTGWQRSYELTLQHMSQVKNYRDNLATAWPPEKSPASAAYIERLDQLLASLQTTYDAAVANHSAFASATLAISLSRTDVKKIYDEYTGNQQKLDAFNAKPKPVQYTRVPIIPQKPPVEDGRQEQLNNQARSIMFGLSGEIIQARGQITKPPAYKPPGARQDGRDDSETPTYTPPIISPPGTFDSDSGSSNSAPNKTQHFTAQPNSPVADSPNTPPSISRQPGLVLGGVQPTPPTPGITPPPPGGGGPLPNVITPGPVLPTPPIGVPPRSLAPGSGGIPKTYPGPGMGRPGMNGLPETAIRAMPPGGVIGGSPGVGLGQPMTGGRSTSRVNPVGGVINNAEGRPGLGGRGAAVGQPMGNVNGRGSGRRSESDETPHWDPDNPWETAEGVSPVVLPVQEQRVDPGPAIGLP
jgi:hypothetical protein